MSESVRVLILTPTALPQVTGNAVTAERWRRSLAAAGHEPRVVAVGELDRDALVRHMSDFSAEVIHAHHLFKAGGPAIEALENLGEEMPLVVSPAGTDLNDDLTAPQRRAMVERVLRRARCVLIATSHSAQVLSAHFPWLGDRMVVVPKAVAWLGSDRFDLREAAECTDQHILFFLPAGVRPVKRNLECLEALAETYRQRSHVRAAFSGPPLDDAYARAFGRAVAEHSFAVWLNPIAPAAMAAALRGADVVLNTSRSEGMANALLEAVAAGVPSLVSNIPANRWAVAEPGTAGPAGLLFDPDDWGSFVRSALRLVDEPMLRSELGWAARQRAANWPSAAEEALALAAAYTKAVAGC